MERVQHGRLGPILGVLILLLAGPFSGQAAPQDADIGADGTARSDAPHAAAPSADRDAPHRAFTPAVPATTPEHPIAKRAAAPAPPGTTETPFLLVGLGRDDALPDAGARYHGLPVVASLHHLHAVRLLGDATDLPRLDDPDIRWAAPEPRITAATHVKEPRLQEQGHHSIIRTLSGWHLATGTSDVRLAVIDSGLDLTHEEFIGRVDAHRDLLAGGTSVADACDHGTPVTGLAAAHPLNERGGAGVAGVSIIVARVLAPDDEACTGLLGDAAEALLWATDQGARVALMSFGSNAPHPALEDAVRRAAQDGTFLVAAAGNTNGGAVQYPAAYPEVIAVGSVRNDRALSNFSPSGPVDLVAPGESLLTTLSGNRYGRVTGTSAAAPLVAGTAALMASLVPDITNTQIRAYLNATAEDLRAPGYDDATGHGLVDTGDALDLARSLINTPPWLGAYGYPRIKAGHPYTFVPAAYDHDGDLLTFSATGLPPGATLDGITGTLRWTPSPDQAGSHPFTVTLSDGTAETRRDGRLDVYLNIPPEAILQGPLLLDARAPALYDARPSHDPDKTPLTFAWDEDLGDGATFTGGGSTRTIAWSTPGRYTAAVRVRDADQGEAIASLPIVVDDILLAESYFTPTYGADDRIRGQVIVQWIGGDDASRVALEVRRYHVPAAGSPISLDGPQGPFLTNAAANGTALIDLEPDIPGPSGRNLPGVHELVITLTLRDSLNGDTERITQIVRYTVTGP